MGRARGKWAGYKRHGEGKGAMCKVMGSWGGLGNHGQGERS